MSCSILTVNHGLVPSTLYVNPTLFSIPCRFIGGLEICNVAVIVTYQVIVHPKSITHEDISSQVADKRRQGLE